MTERARPPLAELAIGLGYMLALAAGLRVLQAVLGQNPLALALAGASAAELAANQAGLRWLEGLDPPTPATAFRVGLRGALPALVAVGAAVAIAAALGRAEVAAGAPGVALGFGLLRAAAIGVRDELLFRGIPFVAAERAGLPRMAAVAFGAVAGAAALALVPGTPPDAIAFEAVTGLAFALLWRHGVAAGVAAHATFALLTGAALHGGLLDVTFESGALTLGGHAEGAPAAIGALTLLACALVSHRLARPRPWTSVASGQTPP